MLLHLATGNAHKLREIAAALGDAWTLKSLADYPELPEPVEDGDTLEANALLKAHALRAHTGGLSVADDTGLLVDALQGAPGVYSARYAGPACSYQDNVLKLLRELEGIPERLRSARFETVIAVVEESGLEHLFRGVCPGCITAAQRGSGGFGYDPVFEVAELGKTFAELSMEEKNLHSHRGKAVRQLVQWLQENYPTMGS